MIVLNMMQRRFGLTRQIHRSCLTLVLLSAGLVQPAWTDSSEPLQIFGFFQNTLMHQTSRKTPFASEAARNSFSVQQHNLFFQKDLDASWRAFVNYEFLNSFNSASRWGSANLEEVWVRYRDSPRLNVKFGLSIPIFNNLNDIKNRTPLLPYVIRPLVYETSFRDFIAVEEYLPARAFVQSYGFVPAGSSKLDYALFLGNGPNINDDADEGQTGVDTTDSFLIGGRIGVRSGGSGEWKLGVSATRDHYNAPSLGVTPEVGTDLQQLTRRRLGADFSCVHRDLSLEAEIIDVSYDDDTPAINEDKRFYYATLGYRATERLFVYGSYWLTQENAMDQALGVVTRIKQRVEVPTLGLAYELRPSIMLKAQWASVDIEADLPALELSQQIDYNHFSTAFSVVF
jgi:hypothetical protein